MELVPAQLEPGLAHCAEIGKLQRHVVVHEVVAGKKGQHDQVWSVFVALMLQPEQLLVRAPAADAGAHHFDAHRRSFVQRAGFVEHLRHALAERLLLRHLHRLDERIAQHKDAINALRLVVADLFGAAQTQCIDANVLVILVHRIKPAPLGVRLQRPAGDRVGHAPEKAGRLRRRRKTKEAQADLQCSHRQQCVYGEQQTKRQQSSDHSPTAPL